jgi:CheY-like chemotaxis protein
MQAFCRFQRINVWQKPEITDWEFFHFPNNSLLFPMSHPSPLFPLKILVAEDNPVNRKVIGTMLEKLGHEVETTADGQEAIDAASLQVFDVIIMDIQMPLVNGLEATRAIRAHYPLAPPVIIALTANLIEADRDTCLAAGMDDYLTKPARMKDLAETLSYWQAFLRDQVTS